MPEICLELVYAAPKWIKKSVNILQMQHHILYNTSLCLCATFCKLHLLVFCCFSASFGITDADHMYLCLKFRQYFKIGTLPRWVTSWKHELTSQDGEGKTDNTFPACFTCVCIGKRQSAYLSLESRYHCRCRHFSTCWSSPSEPWSAGGWRCLGVLYPLQPQGYSPGWSVHPFELQGSTF